MMLVMAVDRSKFRTCEQTSFCRRHRDNHSGGLYMFLAAASGYCSLSKRMPTTGRDMQWVMAVASTSHGLLAAYTFSPLEYHAMGHGCGTYEGQRIKYYL
jgi:hypothetical protein